MNKFVLTVWIAIISLYCVTAAPGERASIEELFINDDQELSKDPFLEKKYNLVGGRSANITDYPYTAAVIENTGHEGSAVIINNKWLLTTAWIALFQSPDNILVRAGSNSAITGGQTRWVQKIIIHPNYTYDWSYDLALIKVKKPFKLNKHVQPIQIADSSPSDKQIATFTGFGFTNTSVHLRFIHTGWLRQSNLPVITYKSCKKHYAGYEFFTNMSFCTAVTEIEGPCFFDYGSPLVYKNKLVGLFSGESACVDPFYPAIFTDVTKLKHWINNTIKHHSAAEKLIGL